MSIRQTLKNLTQASSRIVWLSLACALLFGLCAFVFVGWNSQNRGAAVDAALSAHQLGEARLLLDKWQTESPRDGEQDYYRARLNVILEHPVEAMDDLRKAIDHGFDQDRIIILRAVLFARAGMFDQAEPILRPAYESNAEPKAEIAAALSQIYLATFRLTDAARSIDRWMESAPNDPKPYLSRNDIDERMGAEPPVLVRNYRAALQRDPNFDAAQLGLANLLLGTNEIADAEVEFAAYLARNPDSLKGHVGAGQVALLKGDLEAAEKFFTTAIKIDPEDAVALSELASIDLRNSRFTLARDRLKRAVEAIPSDPEIRYKYSRALKLAGEDDRAAEESAITDRLRAEFAEITKLRQELVEHPDDADRRCKAAQWLIEHGHDKEGLEWTELILRQRPGHPKTCRLLADYYTKKGNAGLANFYRIAASNE